MNEKWKWNIKCQCSNTIIKENEYEFLKAKNSNDIFAKAVKLSCLSCGQLIGWYKISIYDSLKKEK